MLLALCYPSHCFDGHISDRNPGHRSRPVQVKTVPFLKEKYCFVDEMFKYYFLSRYWTLAYFILLLLTFLALSQRVQREDLITCFRRFCLLRSQTQPWPIFVRDVWKTTLISWTLFGLPCLIVYALVAADPYLIQHWPSLYMVDHFYIFLR